MNARKRIWFYGTFGFSHTHRLDDGTVLDKSCVVQVFADDHEQACAAMHASFGDRWSNVYTGEAYLSDAHLYRSGIAAVIDCDDMTDMLETVADVAIELGGWSQAHYDREGREEYGVLATNDSRALVEMAIQWGKEFCEANKDRQWDGEYIEELWGFLKSKKIHGLCEGSLLGNP